jgi:hypothetical protein
VVKGSVYQPTLLTTHIRKRSNGIEKNALAPSPELNLLFRQRTWCLSGRAFAPFLSRLRQHLSLYDCLKSWPGSVLPMPTERTWQQWLERFYNLRRDKRGSHERPHKPVLLLAILDLLDRGALTKNEIELTPELSKTFKRYFEVVRQRDDQPTIEGSPGIAWAFFIGWFERGGKKTELLG